MNNHNHNNHPNLRGPVPQRPPLPASVSQISQSGLPLSHHVSPATMNTNLIILNPAAASAVVGPLGSNIAVNHQMQLNHHHMHPFMQSTNLNVTNSNAITTSNTMVHQAQAHANSTAVSVTAPVLATVTTVTECAPQQTPISASTPTRAVEMPHTTTTTDTNTNPIANQVSTSTASTTNTSIKRCCNTQFLSPVDLRRLKKIRRLQRKVRSLKSGQSKELQRDLSYIEKERDLRLMFLKQHRATELDGIRERFAPQVDEIEKEMKDNQRKLQQHCLKELAAIRKRAVLYRKNNEHPTFSVTDVAHTDRGPVIKIHMQRRYSTAHLERELFDVFANWQHEVNFSSKRATRLSTKNKKGTRSASSMVEWHKYRFHLQDEQIKCDMRLLLDKEAEFDAKCRAEIGRVPQNRFGIVYPDEVNAEEAAAAAAAARDDDGGGGINAQIQRAFHQSPSYADRHHISSVTVKYGFLNEPDIVCGDPYFTARTRRQRVQRVNYQTVEDCENQHLWHSQEVHFFATGSSSAEVEAEVEDTTKTEMKDLATQQQQQQTAVNSKTHYKNMEGDTEEIPLEEGGHMVVVAGFNIAHGDTVRINHFNSDTTSDAMVVSIKKNQLSAVTTFGKRKRVWYKDLRLGKINIVAAMAYR